jgi:hypothetical protein
MKKVTILKMPKVPQVDSKGVLKQKDELEIIVNEKLTYGFGKSDKKPKKKKKVEVVTPKVPKTKHYVNDNRFYYYMVLSIGRGKLDPHAAAMIYKIGINMIRKKQTSYASIEDYQDCLQEGLLACYSNWSRFNHRKYDSPFIYFSEVFKRGTAASMNKIRQKKSYNDEAPIFFSLDNEFKKKRDGENS